MALIQSEQDDIISNINITPMVDIMLVLLIIFMLVSSITDFNAIKVDLPKAATGEDADTKSVSVMISPSGDYFLADRKMASFEDMKHALFLRKQANPDIQVAISADRKTYHEEVVRVIDMLRNLDITRFAINVEYLENGALK